MPSPEHIAESWFSLGEILKCLTRTSEEKSVAHELLQFTRFQHLRLSPNTSNPFVTIYCRVSARRLRCSASLALGSTRCHQLSDWASTKPASRGQKAEVQRSTPLGRASYIDGELRDRRRTTSIVNGNRLAGQSPAQNVSN